MTLKKTLSLVLTLALMLSIVTPWGGILQASAEQVPMYGENLIQIREPVIGGSYYLGADVNGTMMYFRHGTISDTVPYSLVVTDNIDHNWTSLVTLEEPSATYEKYTEGFQLTYINPTNSTMGRIYCMDVLKDATVAGQTGIMDTGVNSTTPYKNRHNFYINESDGSIRSTYKNDHVLVVKQVPQTVSGVTTNVWRMLFVSDTELSNAGVYPAMLLQEHTHSYDEDGICACGKQQPISLQEGIYYLTGKLNGESYYFRKTVTGESVAHTTPYSVCADTDKTAATLVDVILETSGGYSLAYPYNDKTARIYVYDVGNNGTVDTGVNTTNVEANHHFSWDEQNAYFYQMESEVKYVLALKELKNSNTGTNQIRILAVPESQLSDTVVPVKLEAHTQHSCDTWVVETPATASSTGLKTGICTVCGRQAQEVIPVLTPAFYGKSIVLKDAFSMNFYVENAVFTEGAYRNPYVVFDMDGRKTTASAYTQKDNYYIFTFQDISPDKMGKTVTATLYADKQDGTQFSVTTSYSVAQYCYDALEQEQTGDALRTLLVDILYYGAAAQLYRDNTLAADALVNANLTQEQKAWITTGTLRELTSVKDIETIVSAPAAVWYGATLILGDNIHIRAYFTAEDASGLSVVATDSSGNAWTINGDAIKTKDGIYYVEFDRLTPAQMGEKISFCVYNGTEAVSDVLHYSIESYADVMLNHPNKSQELKNLVDTIIRYGDATKAYVQRAFDLQEDVQYLGRTYETNGTQWFNWSASGFSVRFQGSGLKVKIASNAPNATNYAYLKVYVDGVEQTDILLDQTLQTVILAQNLDPNQIHTVEVRKRNSPRSSTAGILNMELLDGQKLAPAAGNDKLIEFVGDSLTVGYSAADVNKTETTWSTKTEDGTKTYSKQVADALNAEYMVTAISGRGVVMNNSGGSGYLLPEIYPELDIYNTPGVAYDFALQPDVVVINLGTNDATNSDLDVDAFQTGVYSFIKTVRQKNPNAQIIWAYGLRSDKMTAQVAAAIEAAVAQINTEGDSKVYYLPLELATEMHLNHPTAAAYAPSGEKIIAKIREITGW